MACEIRNKYQYLQVAFLNTSFVPAAKVALGEVVGLFSAHYTQATHPAETGEPPWDGQLGGNRLDPIDLMFYVKMVGNISLSTSVSI